MICRKVKFFAGLSLFIILFFAYYVRVTDTVMSIGERDGKTVLTTAVYSVVFNDIYSCNGYGDFFTFVTNDEGDLRGVVTNGVAVNKFTGDISVRVCKYLKDYAKSGVDIPLGAFSGITPLCGFGKPVSLKLVKISSVKCDLVSEFEQAGINQVKHSLYVRVMPDIYIIAAGRRRCFEESVEVLVYENVILGEVPDSYIGVTIVH